MNLKFSSLTKFLLISSVILFVFFFPHFYASVTTPSGKVFTGQAFWFDPWDINVYIAAIKWSQKFGLNFQNAYTTQVHKPVLLFPFYTLLGTLFPKSEPFLLYHISSFLLGIVLLFTIYKIARYFLKQENLAFLAVILTALGGGVGWIFYPNILVPDMAITPSTFTGTFERPHEILAVILYIDSLWLFFQGIQKSSKKLIFLSALSINLVIFFYPFWILGYLTVCGGYTLLDVVKTKKYKRSNLISLVYMVLATLPFTLIYPLYLLSARSVLSGVFLQKLATPDLVTLSLGYGVLTPILIYQLIFMKKGGGQVFLNVWFFASLLFAYSPLGFSRLYLRGLFLPASLLVLVTVKDILAKIKPSTSLAIKLILLTSLFSSFSIFYQRIKLAREEKSPWFYITKEEKEVLNFMAKLPTGRGILSSYPFSNLIPAYTQQRVYAGHAIQTPDFNGKITNVEKFYKNEFSNSEALDFLAKNNISYIVWGSDEKKMLQDQKDEILKYNFLKTIYSNSKVNLFTF